jgi:dihydrofolate reductase
VPRRLIVWDVVTLDGYFEGTEKWALDFHHVVWGPELEAFSLEQGDEVGTLLFGRVTYEGMAAHWTGAEGPVADFMNRVPKVVFSSTLEDATWHNTRLVHSDATDEVRRLRVEDGKNLFIFGSAALCGALLEAGLVDELRLGIAPVLLGAGTPFFKPGSRGLRMRLTGTRAFESGLVIHTYEPVPTDAPTG